MGGRSVETIDPQRDGSESARPKSLVPVNAPAPGRLTLSDLLAVLDLGGDVPPVPARCLVSAHGGILGAQLLGQQIVLAERMAPGKTVHSLHTIFSRPGDCRQPLWVDVERLAHGGSIDALALSFRQGSLHICRADVMLRAAEADFLSVQTSRVDLPGPEAGLPRPDRPMMPWEVRVLPRAEPHRLDQWQRIPDAGEDPTIWRALLAHSCELLPLADLLAAAGIPPLPGERPQVAAAVLSQTVTFLDDLDVRDWHLFQVRTVHAGHGRAVGRIEIFGPDGVQRAAAEVVGLLRSARP
ncbi:acyl-CoA thioesterase [Frankia torreyi]|uniref:Acyl-CoA thioesterase n=1 Tax=Frankia torreyi TaxID=1856 RepID=A0A0D8BKZ0_9ACTN|nr:acyl-CoA thioesterase [Frankia torreyi]KQM07119.1 acyl-CoA thioesterase [Frankia sp. CpI1-P]